MNSPTRRSWPYAITAIVVLAFENGWEPAEIRSLTAVLLVLVAVIHAASRDHD
ncbi:hypothetical protein AB0M58_27445 [Streptomyces bobili]|uniref:hypothetical protein n=1 Tax=Streptomyces bobili TaxID=67280 RepID=UPI00343D330D